MNKPKLKIIGENSNAFVILGTAKKALQKAKYSKEKIDSYMKEAMSGDYNNLLCVTNNYFDIE